MSANIRASRVVFMKEDEPVSTLRRDESSALMRQDELEDDEVIPNQ